MKGNQGKILIVLALISLLALSVYFKHRDLPSRNAVIVDQLYGENPSFGFTERCRDLLEENGYSVRVFKGERVTLSLFYESIWGTDIVILRMHSGVFDNRTWLFTHEEYDSSKHVLEQLSGEANIGRCGSVESPVFTVSSAFFQRSLEFENGLVVVMGCNGLEMDDLGAVFMGSGAGAVVGWRGPISVMETDEAVLSLLEHMLRGESLRESVVETGLSFYPLDAGAFRLG